jgi:N-acetyl-gamma-glutamyl-phosphate reductase
MAHKVFVDGQEGTTGLRIHEVLAGRPTSRCCASTRSGARTAAERARLLNAADVAFLCLPDAAAREAAASWSPIRAPA